MQDYTKFLSDTRNVLIAFLSIVLILAILDINLFYIFGRLLETLSSIFMPLIRQILSLLGFSSGTILNQTAELASDTAKFTIDIAEGTVQSVGTLLKKASVGGLTDDMKKTFSANFEEDVPASQTTSPIQTNPTSKKSGFCYIGDFQGHRGCVELSDNQPCLSKQVFATKEMCINPTQTHNLPPKQPHHEVGMHQL